MWMIPKGCETCDDGQAETFPLVVEGEHIGEFCSVCHATMAATISKLVSDQSLDALAVARMERSAVVELCRESAAGERERWRNQG